MHLSRSNDDQVNFHLSHKVSEGLDQLKEGAGPGAFSLQSSPSESERTRPRGCLLASTAHAV